MPLINALVTAITPKSPPESLTAGIDRFLSAAESSPIGCNRGAGVNVSSSVGRQIEDMQISDSLSGSSLM